MITGVGTRIWPDFEQTMLLASSIALLQISLIVPVWKPSSPVPIALIGAQFNSYEFVIPRKQPRYLEDLRNSGC